MFISSSLSDPDNAYATRRMDTHKQLIPSEFEEFIKLDDRMDKRYTALYGMEGRDRLKVFWKAASEKFHSTNKVPVEKIVQGPIHDTESLYWCLFWMLFRANPVDDTLTEQEKDDEAYRRSSELYARCQKNMLHDTIGGEQGKEAYIQKLSLEQLETILHPKLQRLAPMLEKLATYHFIRWLFVEQDTLASFPEHSYEFTRLVLLDGISHYLADDVFLKQSPRPIHRDVQPKSVRSSTSGIKRSSDMDHSVAGSSKTPRSSKKPRFDGPQTAPPAKPDQLILDDVFARVIASQAITLQWFQVADQEAEKATNSKSGSAQVDAQ